MATVVAVSLMLGGAVSAVQASVAAGPLVLPARYGPDSARLSRLEASPDALLYFRQEDQRDPVVAMTRVLGEPGPRVLELPHPEVPTSLVGRQVAYQVRVAEGSRAARARMVDVVDGTVRDGDVVYPYGFGTTGTDEPYFVTGTGDGWLDVTQARSGQQRLARHRPGLPVTLLETLPAGALVSSAIADEKGALVLLRLSAQRSRLDLLDFSTGSARTVWQSDGGGYVMYSLAGQQFVWSTGVDVHTVPRATPLAVGTVRTVPAGESVAAVAVTNTATAWLQGSVPDAAFQRTYRVLNAAGTGAGKVVAGATSVTSAGDRFVVRAGLTSRTAGLYALAPGSSTIGGLLQPVGPSAPGAVVASAGRVLLRAAGFDENDTQPVREQGIAQTSGEISLRGAERALGTVRFDIAAQGGRTATVELSGGTRVAVVRDGTTVVQRLPYPNGARTLDVSGHRVMIGVEGENVGGSSGPPSTLVYDLRSPSAPPRELPGVFGAALAGRRLAYLRQDAAIASLDLDVPGASPVLLRPAGFPNGRTITLGSITLRASGDWVAWSFPSPADGPTAETAVTRVSQPTARRSISGDLVELRLADGMAGWIDRDDRQAHLLDLQTGSDTVLGVARQFVLYARYLALTDGFAAYVAPDDKTRIVRTSYADRPPTLLGGTTSTGVGAGTPFGVALDVTQPLTSYTLSISDTRGAVVRTLTGAAPAGDIRTSWDGRRADGAAVPDGKYTWHLSGTGADGAALRGDGPVAALTGRVVVDRTP